MSQVISILQIITGILLIGMVLVQGKGTGLAKSWGGSTGTSFTRRGLERFLYKSTFIVSAVFTVLSVLQILVS